MRGCSGLGYILDPLRGEIASTQLIARSGHRRRFGMLRLGKSFFASAGIGAASRGMPLNVPAGLSAPAGASQHPSLAASADDPDPAPRHAFAAAERTDARARSTRSGVARRSRRTARRQGTRRVSWGPLPAAIFGVSRFRRHGRERPVRPTGRRRRRRASQRWLKSRVGGAQVTVAFAPCGTRVATASTDSTAMVWSAASGAVELTLAGHARGLTSLSLK